MRPYCSLMKKIEKNKSQYGENLSRTFDRINCRSFELSVFCFGKKRKKIEIFYVILHILIVRDIFRVTVFSGTVF